MPNIQQLVSGLGAGWTVVQGNPVEETVPSSFSTGIPGEQPQTVNRGTGRYYVIVKSPDGQQRALFLKAQPIKGGLEVRQSGVNDYLRKPDGTLDTSRPNPNLFTGSLLGLQWDQAGPVGDIPQGEKKPTATGQLDRLDADGNDATKSGKPAVALRDPSTGTTVNIPRDPAGTVTAVGDNFYVIKPDGSSTVVTGADGKPITATDKPSTFNVPGIGLVSYDPSKPAGSRTTVEIATPQGVDVKSLQPQVRNGKTYVPAPDSNGGVTWVETNLPAQHTYTLAQNDPRSSKILLIDENGNSTTIDKPDFHMPPSAAAGQALTPDMQAPFIVTIGDDGKPVFTPNNNQLTVTDAQRELINQLGQQVAAGSMTEKQAQDLISSITQTMTAQAAQTNAQANMINATTNQEQVPVTAATSVYTAERQAQEQAGTTGANVLGNRATAANNMLNNILSGAAGLSQGSAGRYGMLGGGLQSMPAGFSGEALMGGILGTTAGMFGGQETLDTAARMVRQADPSAYLSPQGQTAIGVLQQAFDKYQQLAGQPHPAVASTRAAAASAANGGAVAPQTMTTNVQTQPQQASWARADQAYGAAPAGNALAPPGVAGAVKPGSPMYLGGFTAPPPPQGAAPTVVLNVSS